MRIGIDGIPLVEAKTGIGHYTLELARSLAHLAPEHEIEIVSPVAFTELVDDDGAPPANLRVVHPQVNSLRKHWWTIGLPLYVREAGYTLFHGTNYNVPLWNRCRTVVSIHDLSLLLHPETHREHLVNRARRRLPTMARWATMIVTDLESSKREICEHLRVKPDKVAVVHLAPRHLFRPVPSAETAETRRRLGIEDEFLLFVGTIEPRKNLITLLRAFDEILRTTDLRPQLVIVGKEGWLTDEIHAYTRQPSLGDRIHFTGYVTDEELCHLYAACRVFVYPSLYEGFGLPPLEAMACGAPVITSRVPSIMQTVGTAALLVNPTDVDELARTVTLALTNAGLREQLSAGGREHAARFTWERTARETLEVYQEALRL